MDLYSRQIGAFGLDAMLKVGRKSPLATKNLLEVTDGLRRPPLEGGATLRGGDAIHQ